MQSRTRWVIGVAIAVVLVGRGTGVALAATSGEDEEPLTGSTLDRALDAALEETGGGIVVETEAGDDGAAYSVEVCLEDGSKVEVVNRVVVALARCDRYGRATTEAPACRNAWVTRTLAGRRNADR
jgi:hypothetical protein